MEGVKGGVRFPSSCLSCRVSQGSQFFPNIRGGEETPSFCGKCPPEKMRYVLEKKLLIRSGDKLVGPLAFPEVQELIRQGELLLDDFAQLEEEQGFRPLGK